MRKTYKDKKEAKSVAQIFEVRKKQMWARLGNISTSRIYRRKSMDILHPFNLDGQPIPEPGRGFPLEL